MMSFFVMLFVYTGMLSLAGWAFLKMVRGQRERDDQEEQGVASDVNIVLTLEHDHEPLRDLWRRVQESRVPGLLKRRRDKASSGSVAAKVPQWS